MHFTILARVSCRGAGALSRAGMALAVCVFLAVRFESSFKEEPLRSRAHARSHAFHTTCAHNSCEPSTETACSDAANTKRGAKIAHTMRWRRCNAALSAAPSVCSVW
jgi:hypothetical protein